MTRESLALLIVQCSHMYCPTLFTPAVKPTARTLVGDSTARYEKNTGEVTSIPFSNPKIKILIKKSTLEQCRKSPHSKGDFLSSILRMFA